MKSLRLTSVVLDIQSAFEVYVVGVGGKFGSGSDVALQYNVRRALAKGIAGLKVSLFL